MGKKHKKHKSDKHTHDEFTERPLKLVLKVAGNEVTTGSPNLESTYDDQVDYDKHKDKKKKKKKKEEKGRNSTPVSPVDDKKKKKMTKKRKGPDSVEPDWDEQSRTPARSDVSQDKPLTPSLARMEDKEQTPLQEALSQLIRQLQRKDPNAFFSFPVTDLIAPGYTLVIKRPMDFSSMKDKVKKEQYQSLEELKLDFRIMCENAMIYNKPDTIYYKAAKKLLHSGMKILSPERLDSLKQSIEFMANLQTSNSQSAEDGEEEGGASDPAKENSSVMDTSDNSQSPRVPNKETPRRDSKDESQKSASQTEKDLEEIKKIMEEHGGKLSNRSLQCEQLDFERRKSDGSTTLGILNPADLSAGDPGYCPVKLGMMGGRLQTGINTLQGFKEDKRNMVTPVTYINYGPYSSYAPTYDSSFANISKDDSDLIYSFYGEESSDQGYESISDCLVKSEEHMSRLADNILDALTNGEHSRQLKETEPENLQGEEPVQKADITDDVEVVGSDPSSGNNTTALTSNLDLPESLNSSDDTQHFQQKLDETTLLLRELQKAQKERLSAKQPPNIICLLAPTAKELQLAEKVTGNLTQLTSQVNPGDVCSIYGIRKAMGISLPSNAAEDTFVHLTTVGDIAEPMEGVC
ncbi:bromodomain-containing protein 7 isoform X1 [Misgurnus anguillicaudatus]|uniref:bromodomain-containing protein 7 isoform X1 n=1 Tax=Misgurnus anguillicaudatus TaxID=75329 RepID=UPI003CCF897E